MSEHTLALFSRQPAFQEKLHVGRPNIGSIDKVLERMRGALERRWLTNNGPLVNEFEGRLQELLGVRHCIPVSNGTIALELCARALGLSGEVIVPSFTFVATAHALRWQGLEPVFGDVDPTTHNLDPAQIEPLITPRTSGILAVHLWGRPADVDALAALAGNHGLKLFFDASHALACSHRGRMIGNFGAAEVFSFHATKFVNSAEGGAIATNDDELAGRLRLMKNFGFAGYDRVVHLGTNGKMSELSAAMGLDSLDHLEDYRECNRRNLAAYRAELAGVPGLRLLDFDSEQRHNYQYVVVEVDDAQSPLHRDELIAVLWAENVIARRYFYPGCHKMEPYVSDPRYARLNLPATTALASRVLLLPNGTAVSDSDIRRICEIIRKAQESAVDVRQALSKQVNESGT